MKTLSTICSRILLSVCFLALAAGQGVRAESTVTVQSYTGFTLSGTPGSPRSIQYVETLTSPNNSWITLTNFNLPASPYFLIDPTSPASPRRFYKAQPEGVTVGVYPGLTISGNVNSTNLIQYSSGPGSWVTLQTVILTNSPYLWVDTISPANSHRTYRAVDIGLPPAITSPGSALAQNSYPYTYQITADSYLPITSYGASGLPAGLGVDPSTGLISGTPSGDGVYGVLVSATSANGTGSRTLSLELRPTLAPNLVLIPAGTFSMGSPGGEIGRDADESPQTAVTISGIFSISGNEVTQAEYQNVVGTNPSFFTGNPNLPVDMVSWGDATNYCALLTARDQQAGHIALNYAYRLPTEAEWEFAARAGTTTAFSFGESDTNLSSYAWYSSNSSDTTHPVGGKLPNPRGLRDVHGNLWEWCSDWYGAYPGGSVTNPKGPANGSEKVIRGGSWFRDSAACRSANRASNLPANQNGDVGFRVVLAPAP